MRHKRFYPIAQRDLLEVFLAREFVSERACGAHVDAIAGMLRSLYARGFQSALGSQVQAENADQITPHRAAGPFYKSFRQASITEPTAASPRTRVLR